MVNSVHHKLYFFAIYSATSIADSLSKVCRYDLALIVRPLDFDYLAVEAGIHQGYVMTSKNCIGIKYETHLYRFSSTEVFLRTRPGFPWTWPGLGNVVLHEGCKMTLVFDISMTILTSFSRQFLPSVLTSANKKGAIPNFSWSKNVVILA